MSKGISVFASAGPLALNNVATLKETPPLFWFPEVSSTMDTAKEIVKSSELDEGSRQLWGVMAGAQTSGRGTRGRTWLDGAGNMYLTVVVPISSVPTDLPVTLVPLRIGTLLLPTIASRVSSQPVLLKWPNDILIADKKVCGILIEWADDHLLIGIGMNVFEAPRVVSENAADVNFGRPAACVADFSPLLGCQVDAQTGQQVCLGPQRVAEVQVMGQEILQAVQRWLAAPDTAAQVVHDFSANMQKNSQKLRSSGEEVLPLSVNADGTLRVKHVGNGSVSSLVADYLY